MTNLITHKRKSELFAWKTVTLFVDENNSNNPYGIKAEGDNEAVFLRVYATIDEALEASNELRDELKK